MTNNSCLRHGHSLGAPSDPYKALNPDRNRHWKQAPIKNASAKTVGRVTSGAAE
jgi:hypothetical protein